MGTKIQPKEDSRTPFLWGLLTGLGIGFPALVYIYMDYHIMGVVGRKL